MTASVVIAAYRRPAELRRLLGDLNRQDAPPAAFDVIVVDDGSPDPLAAALRDLDTSYRLTLLRQDNSGPALARHRGIEAARGDIIIILDDDMSVGPGFVGAHLGAHRARDRRVVLGRVRHQLPGRGTLMQRFHMESHERLVAAAAASPGVMRGVHMYTGNVSFPRAHYWEVGGFDPDFRLLEDAELGMRFELAGASFVLCPKAEAFHDPGASSLGIWMPFPVDNGRAALRLARKHPNTADANPWRFLLSVPAASRPFLVAAALFPRMARALSWPVILASRALAALGLERVARAGVAFTYAIRFFVGVREADRSLGATLRLHASFLNSCANHELDVLGRFAKIAADVLADHDMLLAGDAKYRGSVRTTRSLPADAVRKIGFQMLIVYRVVRFCRASHLTPVAMALSRLMRHLYAADIHWDADLRPGVVLVHGVGMTIGAGTVVTRGCVLSHHDSLGMNSHPVTHESGAPWLEENVYVGPGAVIVGPVRVGADSKVMANAVVMQSVPPNTIVVTPAPILRPRGVPAAAEPSPVLAFAAAASGDMR